MVSSILRTEISKDFFVFEIRFIDHNWMFVSQRHDYELFRVLPPQMSSVNFRYWLSTLTYEAESRNYASGIPRFSYPLLLQIQNCNISCCLSVSRIRPTIFTFLEKCICTRRKHLLFLWWKFSSMLSKQSWLCYAFKITCHLVRFHSLIYSLRSSSASSMNKPEKKGQDKLYSLLPYHHYTRRFYFMRMENCLTKSERLILECR